MESKNDPAEITLQETEASGSTKTGRKCLTIGLSKRSLSIIRHSKKSLSIIGLIILVLLIIIIIIACISTGKQRSEQTCPDVNHFVPPGPACPAQWIGYERKCYFFSDVERNWTSAQNFCTSFNSSLAVIKYEPQKAFVLRYKGTAGHWIGLKKNLNQTWKWAGGTELNNTLEVKGESGDCAFLSSGYAISSQCHIARHWICSHPDIYAGPTLLYTDFFKHTFDST